MGILDIISDISIPEISGWNCSVGELVNQDASVINFTDGEREFAVTITGLEMLQNRTDLQLCTLLRARINDAMAKDAQD